MQDLTDARRIVGVVVVVVVVVVAVVVVVVCLWWSRSKHKTQNTCVCLPAAARRRFYTHTGTYKKGVHL